MRNHPIRNSFVASHIIRYVSINVNNKQMHVFKTACVDSSYFNAWLHAMSFPH